MKSFVKWLVVLGMVVLAIGIWWNVREKKVTEGGVVVVATPTEINKKAVKLAIMADIHSEPEMLKAALVKSREEGDDLVVVAGDLTIDGKSDEFESIKRVLGDSGEKYVAVPGNHDILRESKDKTSWFSSDFGEKYKTVMVEGVKLILIDNSNWRGLGPDQWQWVEQQVGGCWQIVCLAVMHMPLNNAFSGHVMGEYEPKTATEAGQLLKLLKDNGVKQIEAGHLHYATSYDLDGIRTDIVGAISAERNTQTPRYTQLIISGNNIERKVVEVE
jgi:predicted phosphohydrolase